MSLSLRGQEAAEPNDGNFMWTVIQDLWDPDTNPLGYVSLGVAENLLMHDALKKHIEANPSLPANVFTYGDGPTGTRRLKKVLAHFLTKQLKPYERIEPSHITVTNGCSSAIEHLSWALGNPGEGFLLGRPYYGAFPADLTLRTGCKVFPVSFYGVDPFSVEAIEKYERVLLDSQAKGQKVSGILLCHPHNPLGRCYPRDVIVGIMRLCQKYKIHLISDEVYAMSVWSNDIDIHPPPVPFDSCLSIDLTDIMEASRLHVIWGTSKDFGANGIRVGAIISQHNTTLRSALIPVTLFSSASSIAEHVVANFLEDEEWVNSYVEQNRRSLAEHYKLVVDWARQNSIIYAPGVNAGFFLWVDLGRAYQERHPDSQVDNVGDVVMQLLLKQKVFLASGRVFGSEKPGWFRIVFSNYKDQLHEGLNRILAALDA